MPFLIALILILIGLLVFWLGRRSQAEAGLPIGRVIASDTNGWRLLEKPLFSHTHRLAGKPDYLVRRGREIIPVEVKSSQAPADRAAPQSCVAIGSVLPVGRRTYRQKPKYGIVKYADRMFAVDYTTALHAALLDAMPCGTMSHTTKPIAHTTRRPAVRTAGYRHACDERLA